MVYKSNKNIHYGFIYQDKIIIIDNQQGVNIFKKTKNELLLVKKIQFNQQTPHKYHKADNSSEDGKFIFLYFPKQKQSTVYSLQNSDIQKLFIPKPYENEIESSDFSKNEKFLAVGTTNGKVYIYSLKFKRLLHVIALNYDYITSVAFSKENRLIAFSSFKNNLDTYDLANSLLVSRYVHKDVITNVKFLNHSNHIIFAARDNRVYLYDYFKNKIEKELIILVHWAVEIFIDEDDGFCLVSDRSGHLYFVNLLSDELESSIMSYEQSNVIVAIKKYEQGYFFFYENGNIFFMDIEKEKEQTKELFQNGDFEKFFEKINKNPILKIYLEDIFDNSKSTFDKTLKKAVIFICQKDIKQANQLMKPFMKLEKQQEIFNFYLINQKKLQNFYTFYKNKDYARAYALAHSAKFYKNTPYFEELENEFEKVFFNAQKSLLQNNITAARDTLKHFSKVPAKKEIIISLLENYKKYDLMEKLFAKQKYKEFYEVSRTFRFVEQSPICQKFLKLIGDEIANFKHLIKHHNYQEAHKKSFELKAKFPEDLLESLEQDFENLSIIKLFSNIIECGRFAVAIKMVNDHPFLITVEGYKKIEKFLDSRIDKALKFAYLGKIANVHKILANFLKNKFLRNRSIAIYKIAYISQIEILCKKMDTKHWKKTFNNYLQRFGYDGEIDEIAKRCDTDKILQKIKDTKVIGFENLPFLTNIIKD